MHRRSGGFALVKCTIGILGFGTSCVVMRYLSAYYSLFAASSELSSTKTKTSSYLTFFINVAPFNFLAVNITKCYHLHWDINMLWAPDMMDHHN